MGFASPEAKRAYERAHPRDRSPYRLKVKLATFAAYGGACSCCGETTSQFLTIDHVNGDGAQHRSERGYKIQGFVLYTWLRRHGYPKDRFQLLCFNCNWAKGADGVCPHESNCVEKVG